MSKKAKKQKVELGITERLPLIPPNKVMENGKSKQKNRNNVKRETQRIIKESRDNGFPFFC